MKRSRFSEEQIIGLPRPQSINDFGFEQADDRLGQRIVITVADTADGWFQRPQCHRTRRAVRANADIVTKVRRRLSSIHSHCRRRQERAPRSSGRPRRVNASRSSV